MISATFYEISKPTEADSKVALFTSERAIIHYKNRNILGEKNENFVISFVELE